MTSKEFKAKVTGKTTEQRGLIFKKTVYLIALDFGDDTDTRSVSFNQYSSVQIGDIIWITLYQSLNGRWYFSQEEASYSANGFGI